jgi:hypothetical protein
VFFAVVGLAFGLKRFRLGIIALLLLAVATGAYEWARYGSRASENPYLRISEWRPLWTVATPLGWALLMWLVRPDWDKGNDLPQLGEASPEHQSQLVRHG